MIIFFYRCETEIDECLSNPCQNNGTCIDNLGYFECKCTEDYVGDHCEQLRQVTCENQPCKNDAVCKDVKSKFYILCNLHNFSM